MPLHWWQAQHVELPGVGPLTVDEDTEGLSSPSVAAGALGGTQGRVSIQDESIYRDNEERVSDAVDAFVNGDERSLRDVTALVYQYYLDTVRLFREQGWDVDLPEIDNESDVWQHVRFGQDFEIQLGRGEDSGVYVSVECECDWEPEHGLQLVFRSGRSVCKLGPFDGHMTNECAYGSKDFADAVYVSPFDL